MAKKCFKCNVEKDLSEFYKHARMEDGHLGKCKECAKKDALEYREKNIEKIRQYDRDRSKLPHRIIANKLRTKWFRKHNPLKYATHILLSNAVRSGKVKKPNKCQKCGAKSMIHGHHEDYNKPLEVLWLCVVCHKKRHKEIKNGQRKRVKQ